MQKFITHHAWDELALNREVLHIPYGEEVFCNDSILWTKDNKPICVYRSENGIHHFAINDDGVGLERGKLTYAIAFADLNRNPRLTVEGIEKLYEKWEKYLIPDIDVVLFNTDFFLAPIDDLKEIAKDLEI